MMESCSGTVAGARAPFLIGVAGGTASGKTSVCHRIIELLSPGQVDCQQRVVLISQDSFYKNLTDDQQRLADLGEYNFDHPGAFDTQLMKQSLRNILQRQPVEIPTYDFKTHSRGTETRTISATDVVLLEGILVLYDPDIRALMNMKLFVDTDSDTRLSRRVLRDIKERGRTLEHVLSQYMNVVKPAFEEFTLPTKKYADVIIPRGVENKVAINLIVGHISDILSGNVEVSRPMVLRNRTRKLSDSVQARPH